MRAIISVSDKTGLCEFVNYLLKYGFEIFATTGTKKYLQSNGINVTGVEELSGFSEILSGRVKTLHPSIFGGILAKVEQLPELEVLGIKSIDMVVVNLYPFEKTESVEEKLLENIDIGGVALIRAAAKNYHRVTVIVDPLDYEIIKKELEEKGEISFETRRKMAIKAFYITSRYDSIIMNKLWNLHYKGLPPYFSIAGTEAIKLRYGENPHQVGKFYSTFSLPWELIQGKEISYNNILDMEAAWLLVNEFDRPAVAIIKHNNPCGVAISSNINESYIMAYEADKISAYGGIIGLNRPLEIDFAQRLRGVFYELIVAPDFSKEALEFFSKYKKDMRVVKFYGELSRISVRSSSGGYLVQDTINENFEIKYVTKRRPSDKEMEDLLFAWKVVKHVRSNAIVIAKNGVSVGIGAGQMSRIDAVKVAVMKAGERSKGAVLASDAFFPFSDDIEEAASAGISAIIQPGGSKRDEEVIRAAEKYDIAMVFTGIRVFKH